MMLMNEYYKQRLSVQGKQIYENLQHNISKLAITGCVQIDIPYTDSLSKDATNAYRALRFDRPEYYFLGHSIKIIMQSDGMLTIQQDIRFSREHIIRINRILVRTVGDLLGGIRNLPLLEKEKIIYRRVGKGFSYKEGDYAHDLSGLLVYKSGVCESLAGLLVVAFREAGIPAAVVHGYAQGAWHRWTRVWIDDREYYVDVTWDMSNCRQGEQWKYFNLSREQMAEDHCLVENFGEV